MFSSPRTPDAIVTVFMMLRRAFFRVAGELPLSTGRFEFICPLSLSPSSSCSRVCESERQQTNLKLALSYGLR